MKERQNIILFGLFGLFVGVAVWLQFGVVRPLVNAASASASITQAKQPDYSIENFVSVGIDRQGEKYQLSAERLVHDPVDGRAELHRPRVIQYDFPGAPRYLQADSGVLHDDGAELLLYGNVRVRQGAADADSLHGGSVTTTDRMLIRLQSDREHDYERDRVPPQDAG